MLTALHKKYIIEHLIITKLNRQTFLSSSQEKTVSAKSKLKILKG